MSEASQIICESCGKVKIASVCSCANTGLSGVTYDELPPQHVVKLSDLFIESESVPKGEFRHIDLSRVICTKPSEIVGFKQENDGEKITLTLTATMPKYEVKK